MARERPSAEEVDWLLDRLEERLDHQPGTDDTGTGDLPSVAT